jgi:hypothetical protein
MAGSSSKHSGHVTHKSVYFGGLLFRVVFVVGVNVHTASEMGRITWMFIACIQEVPLEVS